MSTIPTNQSLSESIVETVAEAEGVSPVEIDVPLYQVIDPDALDGLFEPTGASETVGRVAFTYHGYLVVVTNDGTVQLVDEDGQESVGTQARPHVELDSGFTKSQ